MSRGTYRAIHTVLIDGADYQALPPNAKLVLLTLKLQLGPSGIDVLYPAVLEEQTGLSTDQVLLALTTLEHAGWIQRERNVVWIVEALKYDPHTNPKLPKHRQGLRSHVAGLPRLRVVSRFVAAYPEHFPADEMPSGTYSDGMGMVSEYPANDPGMVSESGKGKGRGKRERDSRREGDEGTDPPRGGRSTFNLAPYIEAHTDAFPGSAPPAGRYGKVFKRLEGMHGAAEVLRRWKNCLALKHTFATPEELAAHWSAYDFAADPPRKMTVEEELLSWGHDGWYAEGLRPKRDVA